MQKKVVIIGGGIAGLTAGCYAQMNGFDSEIYESHSMVGGLCTSWKRGKYTFDGCIHFLACTSSPDGEGFYKYWNEVGAFQNVKIHNHDIHARITYDKCEVVFYSDIDRLEKHLLDLSPRDAEAIKKMCTMARKFCAFNFAMDKPFEMMNVFDILKMIKKIAPYMKEMKWGNSLTVDEYADTFKDSHIRSSLKKIVPIELPATALIMTLSMYHTKSGGYPIGGSLKFAQGIEENYKDLGGKIFFNQAVKSIRINQKKADGIELADGTFVSADYVISASDLEKTLNNLMGNRLEGSPFEKLFNNDLYPNHTSLLVTLGIKDNFSNDQGQLCHIFPLKSKLTMGKDTFDDLVVKKYTFDKTLAPKNKTVVSALYGASDGEYWNNLRNNNREKYNSEKQRILDFTITELGKHFPGIENNIEEKDVVTPATYMRYTQNYKGAFLTWLETSKNSKYIRKIPNRLKDVENVYFAGQWLMALGGLPGAILTSRNAVQMICKKEKVKFMK